MESGKGTGAGGGRAAGGKCVQPHLGDGNGVVEEADDWVTPDGKKV